MNNYLLSQLPDEIYIIIMKYNNGYIKEIPRWNHEINKWRNHCNVRCSVCKKQASEVALSHLCDRCIFGRMCYCCDNTLICWSCAH